jgi:threonine dehydrogenase-like Zn-dependent dehydrogenase
VTSIKPGQFVIGSFAASDNTCPHCRAGRPPYVVRASAVDRGCAGADAAPVRRCLPQLIDLVIKGAINPGKVFDLTLPLDQVAEGYRAMDERRAIKTLLCP